MYNLCSKKDLANLENELIKVQSYCTERLMSIDRISATVNRIIFKAKTQGISRKALSGSVFYLSTFETMPKSYKFKVTFTECQITFKDRSIVISNLLRTNAFRDQSCFLSHWIKLSDLVEAKVLEKAMKEAFFSF